MKTKLTTLALFAGLCMSASAVSLSWGGNSSKAQIFGLTSGTAMTVASPSQTASMILYYFDYSDYDTIIGLGKVEASALTDYVVATASGQTSTSASAAGRVKQSNTNTDYTTSGNQFFARAYATFGEKTYFIDLFGGTGDGGVWVNEKTGDQSTLETLAWVEGATTSPYGGSTATSAGTKNAWVAVPEPSTAMLALAGLALLIKRRRA